jgi:serine protease Do
VILAVGSLPVFDARALIRAISLFDVGSVVELTVWRDRAQQTVKVTPIEWPNMQMSNAMAPAAMAAIAPTPGPDVKLGTLTDAARQQFAIPPSANGALVESVANDTQVGGEGLEAGDVIVNVNGTPVSTPDEVRSAIQKARDAHQVYVPLLATGKRGLRWLSYYTGIKESG